MLCVSAKNALEARKMINIYWNYGGMKNEKEDLMREKKLDYATE